MGRTIEYDIVKLPRSHLLHVGLVIGVGFLLGAPWVLATLPRTTYWLDHLALNLVQHLRVRHQIQVQPGELIMPRGGAAGLEPTEVYFLGRRRGQKNRDVFFAHFIHSTQGVPVHASPAFSLSRTRTADEAQLRYDSRRYLAYSSLVKGRTSVITVLDLAGLSRTATDTFTPIQRLQQRLTSWQDTGRWRGLDRLEVRLPVPQEVSLRWSDGKLLIRDRAGRWQAAVDPVAGKVLSGPARARRVRVGQRSFVAWAVDTVRGFSFVGPDRIAWLEDQVYGLVDQARRMSGSEMTASQIQDEMALPVVTGGSSTKIQGWPPPPLKPILRRALPHEGKWVQVKGPFLRSTSGMPSLFSMTFVRPDAERLFARVYFVAWDPRRVELRMRGGTREPRSATGHRGDGTIPRKPAVLGRLVGAFNGGFQSIHGDFGMMVNRKVAIPAKPWGATVARLADGSTGFGTWDGKARYGWTPQWIRSFRQNLTALVEDGKFNPWRRGSWGGGVGLVSGSGPKAHIIRSGLCLHRSGHVMYVQGEPVDGPILGQTMKKVGCIYGMELDINKGHVGFEFYNVRGPEEAPPRGAEAFKKKRYFSDKGRYPGVKGFTYYMREVTRGTGNRCPRWIGREARDFFYLVQRRMLPGADLAPLAGAANEGRWTLASLPRAAVSFPRTMARTILQPAAPRRVHLLALDLRWLDSTLCVPRGKGDCLPTDRGAGALAVLPLGAFHSQRALSADGKLLLGSSGGGANLTIRPLRPGGAALPSRTTKPGVDRGSISVEGVGIQSTRSEGRLVRAALCADASQGQLLYATGMGASREELKRALAHAGCKQMVPLGVVEPLVLVTSTGLRSIYGDAFPPIASSPSLVLRRSRTRWGTRIFSHVKVQPRSVWTAVQPEATRSTHLRHANRAIARLGLPPIKTLRQLCRPPYDAVKELRKHRWKNPITGKKICGGTRGKGKGKGRRK